MLLLCGCDSNSEMDDVMGFRQRMLTSDGYILCAQITADYGDAVYSFTVECTFDQTGTMDFIVTSPQTIHGITGTVDGDQGKLTFDDQALLFELLADGQLSPISAPWIAINALRSGYIQSCGVDGDNIRIILDDSYDSNALRVDWWVTKQMIPIVAEISWQNRRILTMQVVSFSYL